jgi:hypothetical protein
VNPSVGRRPWGRTAQADWYRNADEASLESTSAVRSYFGRTHPHIGRLIYISSQFI